MSSAVRLRRQASYAVAAEMLLTGEDIPARRAYELGLINRVTPDGQSLAKAREIADRIARNGPLAVRAILTTLRDTECLPEQDAFAIEQRLGSVVMRSSDAEEGPRAFLEKRAPDSVGHRRSRPGSLDYQLPPGVGPCPAPRAGPGVGADTSAGVLVAEVGQRRGLVAGAWPLASGSVQ